MNCLRLYGRRWRVGDSSARLSVQPPSHFSTGLEIGERFSWDRYWLACLRVAPSVAVPKPDRECSKTTKLDAVTANHGIDSPIEDNVHDLFDVALI
jgi:hypothetical protein